MSIGPKEIKKFRFTIFTFLPSGEVVQELRLVTKPMTKKDFNKLLKKELAKCEPNCCYRIGDFK